MIYLEMCVHLYVCVGGIISSLYWVIPSYLAPCVCVCFCVCLISLTHDHTLNKHTCTYSHPVCLQLYVRERKQINGRQAFRSNARSEWGREKWWGFKTKEANRLSLTHTHRSLEGVNFGAAPRQPPHWFSCQPVKFPAAVNSFCLSSVRIKPPCDSRLVSWPVYTSDI